MPAKYYNEYMNTYMKARYEQRRKKAIAQHGGCCVNCGSEDDLHFHHRDPETKEFTIARGSSLSQSRWESELAKCDLLCGECHRAEHAP